jgi:hypothetical protein
MNFGTQENPCCGICGRPEEAHYRGDTLMEDVICVGCSNRYAYVDDNENTGYSLIGIYHHTTPTFFLPSPILSSGVPIFFFLYVLLFFILFFSLL